MTIDLFCLVDDNLFYKLSSYFMSQCINSCVFLDKLHEMGSRCCLLINGFDFAF